MWIIFVLGAAAFAGLVILIGKREDEKKRALRELHWEEVDLASLDDDPDRRKEILKRRKPKNS